MSPRRSYLVSAAICFLFFFGILGGFRSFGSTEHLSSLNQEARRGQAASDGLLPLDQITLSGKAIAPKLGNETAKAELGRATWKFFHTVMARFPEKPTEDEKSTLRTFIYSFQRVYPCGDCATHFGELLKKFPPQVSSRNAAAGWACHVHNQVNIRLKKEIFDCNNIGDFYDCGCAKDEEEQKKEQEGAAAKPEMSDEQKEKVVFNGRDFNEDLVFS